MKIKIDMTAAVVTRRLQEVEDLRGLCLALADSSASKKIREKCQDNPLVQRTLRALGRK
jgi:hypothetical protein